MHFLIETLLVVGENVEPSSLRLGSCTMVEILIDEIYRRENLSLLMEFAI